MLQQENRIIKTLCLLLGWSVFLFDQEVISVQFDKVQWLSLIFHHATINPRLIFVLSYLHSLNGPAKAFIFLFVFRYTRLLVNLAGFWAYKLTPALASCKATLGATDVTVIIPTIDSSGSDFAECIATVVANRPASIIIITAGRAQDHAQLASCCQRYTREISITILRCPIANKRLQTAYGLAHATTAITVLCDDHVFWPTNFLPILLAPFESLAIGAVATAKRARHHPDPPGTLSWRSFWNLMGILYLERHNFETRATNALDGGVFVISGRTAAYRTSILREPAFLHGFLNEYICFGLVGPLSVDDDNFITRWIVTRGWGIKMQCGPQARVETTLGEYPKFLKQCVRWSRTTWRSNPVSLFGDRVVWRRQPWCVYAAYIASLANFALLFDVAMVWTLGSALERSGSSMGWMVGLVGWILLSKVVKVAAYFWEYPRDVLLLPAYILFGYVHSFIKLYAMLTFWDISWSGRNLVDSEVVEGCKES